MVKFLEKGCRCKLAGLGFNQDVVLGIRGQYHELTHTELGMVLMGALHTIVHTDAETMQSVRYRHDTEVGWRTYGNYLHYTE